MRALRFFITGSAVALLAASALQLHAQVSVLTWHNDNARTGFNPAETILNRTNVNANGFGVIFSLPVDGWVYAQPLYVSGVSVPGKGVHNVVFVATQHDSVYAFDADTNAGTNASPLWHASFINPAAGITTASVLDAVDYPYQDCRTFSGEIGIVGTPVIDLTNGTLFVVARTKEPLPPPNNQTYVQVQRLHALDIATGNERSNSPVAVSATVPGTGDGAISGYVSFNPAREMQRSALTLSGGVVYIPWASYCDLDPFHGWIIGYDARSLQQSGVFNATPNGREGGFWMGGAGLAAAPDGSLYGITGNGSFDTNSSPTNFGDSYVRLIPGTNLVVSNYFTPFNQGYMDSADQDLGAGGALVLPDSVGSLFHPHLLAGAGKDGMIYLLDRDSMGHFNPIDNSQIVQQLPLYSLQGNPPHFFGLPAFFNNRLYFQGVGEYLKAYTFANGLLNSTPVSQSTETVGFRGATPSISANGTNDSIVWQLDSGYSANPSLRAYNADNLSQKLYDSWLSYQSGAPDQLALVKFVVPTVANGKVYLGTPDSVAVFGLRSRVWSYGRSPASSTFTLVYSGPLGYSNVVQVSSDLAHWTDLGAGYPTNSGRFGFTDPVTPGNPVRYYRVRFGRN
jgi:hypothetical protein